MKEATPYKNSHYTNARADAVREKAFSTSMRVGALVVSGVLGGIAIASTAPVQETLAARIVAVTAVIATVMLWLRNKYALYAWSILLATIGLGYALLSDTGGRGLFYWAGKLATIFGLFWCAYLLFLLSFTFTLRLHQ